MAGLKPIEEWTVEEYEKLIADDDESIIPRLIIQDIRRCAQKARLSPSARAVLEMYAVFGWSVSQIAAVKGVTPQAVHKQLAAAWNKVSRIPDLGLLTVLAETFPQDYRSAFYPIRDYVWSKQSFIEPHKKLGFRIVGEERIYGDRRRGKRSKK